jgi:crossover junction endodeoxyribonuclease RuvC
VLLLLCLDAGLEIYEYAPAEIKRSVTGRGTASKEQVQEMLRRLLLRSPEHPSQDESDALAIAYCHLSRPPVARAQPLQACRD